MGGEGGMGGKERGLHEINFFHLFDFLQKMNESVVEWICCEIKKRLFIHWAQTLQKLYLQKYSITRRIFYLKVLRKGGTSINKVGCFIFHCGVFFS